MDWISVENELPPDGTVVMAKTDDGKYARNEAELIRKGNLWYLPNMSMYVYYKPTHWKFINAAQR